MDEKKMLFKLALLCCILIGNTVYSQDNKKNIPPLYIYLQNNADSTIVMTYERDLVIPTRHFILSKKSTIITPYLYESPYNRKENEFVPKSIRIFFQKRDIEINKLKVDTNAYFNAKYMKPKKRQDLWRKTMLLAPWEIKDDITAGEGCNEANKERNYGVYDGGSISLYLITADRIKHLYFYAPSYYKKKCPKEKKGRKSILELEKIFKIYFDRK